MIVALIMVGMAAVALGAIAFLENRWRAEDEREREAIYKAWREGDEKLRTAEKHIKRLGEELDEAAAVGGKLQIRLEGAEARHRRLMDGLKELLLDTGMTAHEAISVGLAMGEAKRSPTTPLIPTGRGGTLADVAKRARGGTLADVAKRAGGAK
jgi:hypothetical protein